MSMSTWSVVGGGVCARAPGTARTAIRQPSSRVRMVLALLFTAGVLARVAHVDDAAREAVLDPVGGHRLGRRQPGRDRRLPVGALQHVAADAHVELLEPVAGAERHPGLVHLAIAGTAGRL